MELPSLGEIFMPKTAPTPKATKAKKAVKSTKKETTPKKKTVGSKIIKKKPYFEFVTAFLSIPVLITVLLLNVNTLKGINNAKVTPTPGLGGVNSAGFFAQPVGDAEVSQTAASLTQAPCEKGLGPVSISSPNEDDKVEDNPVVINIDYDDSTYCGAAWSYRINGGTWSGYDDRSVALYNLPQGPVKFELRVKSIVTADEKNLTRNFIYSGKGTIDLPSSGNSSGSAR